MKNLLVLFFSFFFLSCLTNKDMENEALNSFKFSKDFDVMKLKWDMSSSEIRNAEENIKGKDDLLFQEKEFLGFHSSVVYYSDYGLNKITIKFYPDDYKIAFDFICTELKKDFPDGEIYKEKNVDLFYGENEKTKISLLYPNDIDYLFMTIVKR